MELALLTVGPVATSNTRSFIGIQYQDDICQKFCISFGHMSAACCLISDKDVDSKKFQVLGPFTGPVTAHIWIGGGGSSSSDGGRTKVSTKKHRKNCPGHSLTTSH